MTIRDIRKELGLSQLEFARMLGVHQTAVSQWETGRTSPEIEIVKQISRISGHSLGDVLNVSDAPSQNSDCFELRMSDGGMIAARIAEGDTVYLKRLQGEPEEGGIYAVRTSERMLIRYLYRAAGGWILTAAAPGFPPVALADDARILGQAYAFRSAL